MRAYSYIRFSSARQASGDSLRRQLAAAEEYCEKHGLDLDSSSYRDLGVSAYDKSNFEKGALASFLQAIKDGKVAPGTTLIIEALDRLTRAEVPTALHLLNELCKAGIRVVTLEDEQIYDADSIQDTVRVISSVVLMSRAHDESRLKSKRVRDHFKKRLKAGEYVGHTWPVWLKKTGPAHFEPIPERVAVVQRLFDLTAKGHGCVDLTRRANEEGWPSLSQRKKPSGWHHANILKLLRNRAVLGEYQPTVADKTGPGRGPAGMPVQMFPPVITPELFQRVQTAIASRANSPRRRSLNYLNVFQGMLLCGHCGAGLLGKNKSNSTGRVHRYYVCADQARGLSDCPRYPAIPLLGPLIHAVFAHIAEDITLEARISTLRTRRDAAKAQAADAAQRLNRLLALVEAGTDAAPAAVRVRIQQLDAEQSAAEREAQDAAVALATAAAVLHDEDLDASIASALDAVGDPAKQNERVALHARLSLLVEHIWYFGGYAALRLRGERMTRWLPLTDSAEAVAVLMNPPPLPQLRKHHLSPAGRLPGLGMTNSINETADDGLDSNTNAPLTPADMLIDENADSQLSIDELREMQIVVPVTMDDKRMDLVFETYDAGSGEIDVRLAGDAENEAAAELLGSERVEQERLAVIKSLLSAMGY